MRKYAHEEAFFDEFVSRYLSFCEIEPLVFSNAEPDKVFENEFGSFSIVLRVKPIEFRFGFARAVAP